MFNTPTNLIQTHVNYCKYKLQSNITYMDFSQHSVSVRQTIVMTSGCEKEVEGELLRFIRVTCIKQGEMEGSAKYMELLRMAENYFQQSLTKEER